MVFGNERVDANKTSFSRRMPDLRRRRRHPEGVWREFARHLMHYWALRVDLEVSGLRTCDTFQSSKAYPVACETRGASEATSNNPATSRGSAPGRWTTKPAMARAGPGSFSSPSKPRSPSTMLLQPNDGGSTASMPFAFRATNPTLPEKLLAGHPRAER